MLVKTAKTIVDGMAQGLKNGELEAAIVAALAKYGKSTADTLVKDAEAVRNEYVQHSWDVEDLTGAAAPKTAKKATKKAKKAAKKAAAKPVTAKKEKGPSRVQRMFEHVLAGMSNEAAVEAIKKEFGKVPTNVASIGWCRSQLKAKTDYAKKYNPKGKAIPTDAKAKARASK